MRRPVHPCSYTILTPWLPSLTQNVTKASDIYVPAHAGPNFFGQTGRTDWEPMYDLRVQVTDVGASCRITSPLAVDDCLPLLAGRVQLCRSR